MFIQYVKYCLVLQAPNDVLLHRTCKYTIISEKKLILKKLYILLVFSKFIGQIVHV